MTDTTLTRWRKAFFEARALVVLSAAGTTAAALPAGLAERLAVAVLGVAAYGAVAAGNLRRQAAGKYEVEEPSVAGLEERYAAMVRAGADARRRILQALAGTPDPVRGALEPLLPQVRSLGARQEEMARRLQELERALREADGARLAGEREQLAGQAQHADPVVRQQAESALRALESRRESLDALAMQVARLAAQMQNVQQTLEAMHPKLLHLAAAGSGSAGGECAALNVELAHLNADVDALSRSVEQVYGPMVR